MTDDASTVVGAVVAYTRIYAAVDADKAATLSATRLAALAAWVLAVIGDDAWFPLRVVIPPDEVVLSGLAVPAGRWQQPLTLPRQNDGGIVVVYASAKEMAVCREAARVYASKAGWC